MANALHKTTLEYRTSVDITELPGSPDDWLRNPTLPDCERKYWRIDGGTVAEMSTEQKAAVDAAEATAALNAARVAKVADITQAAVTLLADPDVTLETMRARVRAAREALAAATTLEAVYAVEV